MTFSDLDALGKKREPFLFISDFEAKTLKVFLPKDLQKENIYFSIDSNAKYMKHGLTLQTKPINFQAYKEKFDKIIQEIKAGNTYVLNLTQETPVELSVSLKEVFTKVNAPYKLYYKDEFVCFSPECFVKISQNKIHTFPMKGTIDASIKDAKVKILADTKEMAEHIMIVDLLRNDLSIVAKEIKVEKFRFISEIKSAKKTLLHVSSHISGKLEENWHENIGTILESILPAGSISGAPKKSTVEIIKTTEGYKRDFFSGVFGYYDGETLDSGVMIRFLQRSENGYVYKSGGGITLDSVVSAEYQEIQDKIYLP